MINVYLKSLHGILTAYKNRIDELEKQMKEETERSQRTYDPATFNPAYIEQQRKNDDERIVSIYGQKVRKERESVMRAFTPLIRKIRKELDIYANDPPRESLVNRISLYYASGMDKTLSQFELQALVNDSRSFSEKRIIESLVEKRRIEAESKGEQFNVSVDIPQIESAWKILDVLESASLSLIRNYAGREAGLYKFCADPVEPYYAVSTDAVLVNKDYFANFREYCKPIEKSWEEQPLSAEEANMLDAIINSETPYGRKCRVEEVAKTSAELRALLRKSEKYSEYVPAEEE